MTAPAYPALLSTAPMANWSTSLVRYYLIDYTNGSDASRDGYIDAAAGATFSANDLSGVPIKTLEHLYEIVPPVGNGRSLVILQRPRLNASGAVSFENYLDRDGSTQSSLDTSRWSGYRTFLWRGSTDLSNDSTDKVTCGFGVAVVGPNADSSFTVTAGASTTVVPVAAGTIAAEGATQFRIRFIATTTTATLRNVCRVITSCVANTSVTCGNALPATPANGDKFVIEQPGVRVNQINFDGHVAASYIGTDSFLGPGLIGIAATATATETVSIGGGQAIMASGIQQVTSTTNGAVQIGKGLGSLWLRDSWFDETGASRTIGMGMRINCGSQINRVSNVDVQCFGAMNLSASTNAALGPYGDFGPKSYFGGRTFITGAGASGVNENTGTSSVPFQFGDATTSNAQPRVVSNGTDAIPFTVSQMPANIWRVNFENFAAATHGCIYLKHFVGGSMNIDGCTSSGTQGTFGIDVSQCADLTLLLGTTIANTVTGSSGDIATTSFATPVALSHTDLTKVGFRDPAGNILQGTAGLTGGVAMAVTNDSGGAMAPGDIVYLSASSKVKKSKADAAATALADGIMVSTTADQAVGLMVPAAAFPYVKCASAPAANAMMYLSEATAGVATSSRPATAGTNQALKLGRNVDGDGAKTAVRIAMNPELTPTTA